MEKQAYEYLYSLNDEIELKEFEYPLFIENNDEFTWLKIDEKMAHFVTAQNKKYSHEESVEFEENIENLISGTLNTINYILLCENRTPIKTIVFLDKSARLAAHIFRVLWSTLKKQNKIPMRSSMPNIRYVNIGRDEDDKHDSKRALKLASEIFSTHDIKGEGVLVIDEVVDTGGSLKKALDILNNVYGANAHGMASFIKLPKWYTEKKIKGVVDVNINPDFYRSFDYLDDSVFEFIKSIVRSDIPKAVIFDFLKDIYLSPHFVLINYKYEKYSEKYSLYRQLFEDELLLQKVHRELNPIIRNNSIQNIIDYFESSGGFKAKRPDNGLIRKSYRYRQYLTKMVEIVSNHINTIWW